VSLDDMMPKGGVNMGSRPRREVINPDVVGVYHCWNRCVRRSWLCGIDPLTGKDYEYRRDWIVQRETLLARLFAIEIGWHGELANHIHLILRNRPDVVATWSDEEVVRRVLIINRLTRNFGEEIEEPSIGEINIAAADPDKVAKYRRRLADVSAFMASLDEYIARRANHEDNLTGTFWEARFGCRNLEDETAILVCGMYIDLNQIRAGEAMTPEQSTHTSAYNRIQGARFRMARLQATAADVDDNGRTLAATDRLATDNQTPMPPDGWLCELTLQEGLDADVRDGLASSTPWRLTDKGILPIRLEDYLSLLDWTGRQHVAGKTGSIPDHLAPILERLHIRPGHWLDVVFHFDTLFGSAIGRAEPLAQRLANSGRHWIRGARHCAAAFT
jgi:hypothetical protein